MLENLKFNSEAESRALASFMALAIGDALGVHTEFLEFNYNRVVYKNKFEDFTQF